MHPPLRGAESKLVASYEGLIVTTYDALVLFESCLAGKLNHVARRPHERERDDNIKSGNVFIYEEHSSGIKRWTDGISWSPSRILGNFLIYRQLVKSYGPGEKKKALKKTKAESPTGIVKNSAPAKSRLSSSQLQRLIQSPKSAVAKGLEAEITAEVERGLIGSLTDSYDFMEKGLVKKTISITYKDVVHHLVSYYTVEDALKRGKNMLPSMDPNLTPVVIRPELTIGQNFRSAAQEIDPLERNIYGYFGYPTNEYHAITTWAEVPAAAPTSLLPAPPPEGFPTEFQCNVSGLDSSTIGFQEDPIICMEYANDQPRENANMFASSPQQQYLHEHQYPQHFLASGQLVEMQIEQDFLQPQGYPLQEQYPQQSLDNMDTQKPPPIFGMEQSSLRNEIPPTMIPGSQTAFYNHDLDILGVGLPMDILGHYVPTTSMPFYIGQETLLSPSINSMVLDPSISGTIANMIAGGTELVTNPDPGAMAGFDIVLTQADFDATLDPALQDLMMGNDGIGHGHFFISPPISPPVDDMDLNNF
jgi:hypothetical protein